MKVVIFCGGQGLRLREFSENIPKPMVPVGFRPIIWHTMKYYAHFGYKEFILALGWKADVIKDYFLRYDETVSNDFVLSGGGRDVKLLNSDIHDWKITFVDTGVEANLGMRLMRVREHLENDEWFMCNYSDCLTDAPLPAMIDYAKQRNAAASFVSVKPSTSFHVIQFDQSNNVSGVKLAQELDIWINGGYWVMHRDFFDHIKFGEEITNEPMQRLIAKGRAASYQYRGFWGCMDTFKEKMMLDDMVAKGKAPWQLWQKQNNGIVTK
jgi:glucose-1-phosphate cytidylyltransferase